MKLPRDRKERIKVFALLAAGLILAIYGVVTFAARPLMKSVQARRERIQILQKDLEKAQLQIVQMQKGKESNVLIVRDLARLSGDGGMILNPRLGNYLLSAQEIINDHARNCGLTVDAVRELGLSGLQPQEDNAKAAKKKKPGKQLFQAYSAQVVMNCGIHDLTRLLGAIETSNPYLCVSSIDIAAQASSPDKHTVTFQVQWPVWENEEQKSRIERQNADLEAP
jgi:hypothetical protein